MIRLLLIGLTATVLFALFAAVALAIGERSYRQPALLARLDACELPCWHGIRLGQTTVEDAIAILDTDGFVEAGATSDNNLILRTPAQCQVTLTFFEDRVTSLRFTGCEAITIGDLMLALGNPNSIIPTGGFGDWWRWHDNLIEVGTNGKVLPRTVISSLGFDAPGDNASSGRPWHGFIPFWRFCRLERVPYFCPGIPPTAA